MNLAPLLETEKESVECSELFTASSVFPLEVWGMLFPGSIGFIQIKMEQLQLPPSLHHHTSRVQLHPRVRCSSMMCILSILYGLNYTKGRRLLFATTH